MCLLFLITFRYGFKKILRPLIDDLKRLERDDGVQMMLNDGSCFTLRAVLCHVLGDSLAMHDIFELTGTGSTLFCRACYANRNMMKTGMIGDHFRHRSRESSQQDLDAMKQGIKLPKDCGIIRECSLHELKYFHLAVNNTFDPMHDLLEGIVKLVIQLILNVLVNDRNVLTEDNLNQIITDFKYGITESRDKPSANFKAAKLKQANSINQSAAQTWLLLRAFPFMFNQFLQFNPLLIDIVSCVLKITYYTFSNKLTNDHVDDLDSQITRFYDLFLTCFPEKSPTNKLHHISHYPETIHTEGPVALFSCMLFENKFRESKQISKTCGNFNNFTYSLTKRLNLRQIRSILNYDYSLGRLEIISSKVVRKELLKVEAPTALLDGLPESIENVNHCKIDNTSFRPGVICRYVLNEALVYGTVKFIVAVGHDVFFFIQSVECVEFSETLNAYKIKDTGIMERIVHTRLLTRKTYSVWTNSGDPSEGLYISLKYNDW